MIKIRNMSASNFLWHFCFFTLLFIPAVQLCKSSSSSTSQGQLSTPCNQNISTDLPINSIKISKVPQSNQKNICPFADMCLQITTGTVSDHARLYYSTKSNARKTILQGYLICGGDGVSVIGTTPSFDESYMTLRLQNPGTTIGSSFMTTAELQLLPYKPISLQVEGNCISFCPFLL